MTPGRRGRLTVLDPGFGVTIQDRGRIGFARWAISPAGAADRGAMARANRLVGNTESAPVLELVGGGQRFHIGDDTTVALAGAPLNAAVTAPVADAGTGLAPVRGIGPAHAFSLYAGDNLHLGRPWAGLRTYLAIRGGVAGRRVFGSASTDSMGGIGPPALVVGSEVLAGTEMVAAPRFEPVPQPTILTRPTLRVLEGPRLDWMSAAATRLFTSADFVVSPLSDRIGVRLDGPEMQRRRTEELASEALLTGAVQLPPSGQPIIFGPDHPTTGGYPVIAVVIEADLDTVAQLRPGQAVRFRWVC